MDMYQQLLIGDQFPVHDDPNWLSLHHGVGFNTAQLNANDPPWVVRREMTKARMAAITLTRRNAGAVPVFTGESALISHGIDTMVGVPDLLAWRLDGQRISRTCTLRPLNIGGVSVPSAQYRSLTAQRLGDDNLLHEDVHVVGQIEAAIDLARFGHPVAGILSVSAVLRALSGYTNFDQHLLPVAERIKNEMVLVAGRSPQGYKRAATVISASDPGIVGPGEAFLTWNVGIVGDEATIASMRHQHSVSIGGRQYYLDIAFPECKACLEFEGTIKLDMKVDARQNFVERHTALTNNGWSILRATRRDLHQPWAFARKLAKFMNSVGLGRGAPQRGVIKQIPAALLDVSRW